MGSVIADGYAGQQSYRPGDLVELFLNAANGLSAVNGVNAVSGKDLDYVFLYDYTGKPVFYFPANLVPQTINWRLPLKPALAIN
jgi:hypothetical protein